jgi:uncharacterized membrane protein
MNSLPLHPAVVHLPLALSILMPLFAAGLAWAVWTGRIRPRAYLLVVALQALLVGSGFVAMNTGGAEEERVEAVVQESALETHEELAEQFVWAAGGTLALAGLVVLLGTRAIAAGLSAAVVIATVVVAALGLRVGHAGGRLVYVHGAASAYTSTAASTAEASSRVTLAPDHKDRD